MSIRYDLLCDLLCGLGDEIALNSREEFTRATAECVEIEDLFLLELHTSTDPVCSLWHSEKSGCVMSVTAVIM